MEEHEFNKELYEKVCRMEEQMSVMQQQIKELQTQQLRVPPVVSPSVRQPQPMIALPVKRPVRPVKPRGDDFEQRFGRNVMGIIASVMIFIALLLFVSIIFQVVNDVMKAVTLYTISTAILVCGLFFRKKNSNAFSKSLIICGVGAFYISVLMTYFAFELVGQVGMYLLIIVWMSGTAYLSRRIQSSSAAVIGQLGITISVLMGSLNCDVLEDLYFLLFFFVGCSLFYQILYRRHEVYGVRMAIFIMGILACISYTYSFSVQANDACGGFTDYPFAAYIPGLLILLAAAYAWYLFFLKTLQKGKNSGNVAAGQIFSTAASVILVILLLFGVRNCYTGGVWWNALLLFTLSFLILAELMSKTDAGRQGSVIFCVSVAFINIIYMEEMFEVLRSAVLWLPALGYAYWKKDKLYWHIGIFLLIPHAFYIVGQYYPVNEALFLLGAGAVFFMLAKHRDLYMKEIKMGMYILLLVNLCRFFFRLASHNGWLFTSNESIFVYAFSVFFFILAGINIAALYTRFINNWNASVQEREEGTYILCRTVNGILWGTGMSMLYWRHMTVLLQLSLVLVTIVLAFIGSKYLIQKRRNGKYTGIYLGVKLTVTAWVVFASFDIFINIAVSLLLLLLAVVAVLAGFRLEMKSFRVYGLCLSMVGVVKLLLYDVSYGNSLQRVLGFFMAGVLCFVINFIYNYLNRKYIQKNDEKEELI